MAEVLLIGASGLAREALAVIREAGVHRVVGVLDDQRTVGDLVDGVPVLGPVSLAARRPEALLVCIGSGVVRERVVARLQGLGVADDRYITVIDPSVRNPGGSPVGHGSIVLSHVAITTAVTIGSHVVVMPLVTLTHDDVLEDFATVAGGVSLAGDVVVGRGAYLGTQSSVREHRRIGDGATLGMGAVLIDDLPAGETWAGVPAKPLGRSAAGAA